MRLSGLQKEVLSLYRNCLRESRHKPQKGSPHHPTKFNYSLPADAGASHPQGCRPSNREYESFLPRTCATSHIQKQRRISRNQHGLRVSRRIPTRSSRGSIPPLDGHASPPPSQEQQSAHNPYWGTLHSPSASRRKSRIGPQKEEYPVHRASDEDVDAEDTQDELLLASDSVTGDLGFPPLKRSARTALKQHKRFGLADPAAWDVIARTLVQQQRLSNLTGPQAGAETSIQQTPTRYNEGVSRTSSQERRINRFTRQLEKYADAAGAAGKAPVMTPTISESRPSFHTIKPLVPYKDEFSAAGLAVTSSEQGRRFADRPRPGALTRPIDLEQNPGNPAQKRQELRRRDDFASRASTSKSYASSGSYDVVDPLQPRKATAKPKPYNKTRRHLLSCFLRKPSTDSNNSHKQYDLIQNQKSKKEENRSNGLPPPQMTQRPQPLRMNPNSSVQKTREMFKPTPALPAKYVTPKRGACVATTAAQFERLDRRARENRDSGHYTTIFDARPPPEVSGSHTKRNISHGALPRASSDGVGMMSEEMENSARSVGSNIIPSPSPVSSKGKQADTTSSGTTKESAAPSLPFAATTGTVSSLQRALEDASHRIDEEDRQTQNPSKEEHKIQKTPLSSRLGSHHSTGASSISRKARSAGNSTYMNMGTPNTDMLRSISKPLPPWPAPDGSGSPPGRQAPAIPPRPLTGKRKNAVAELAKAEEALKDLDVFLNDNFDDADIKDRDVIRGLRVATHAAADDLYDAYVRHKTGLRIRRFLADLRSLENINEPSPAEIERRARERRAESRRLQRLQNRTGHRL
ncbi:hypothetical protein F5Y17DRAFT_467842 [Xylariaceae sp. FL0594]|nr:hypothetical protein F5Y17DRAFT_467842 [Xylariaceae sp. FL0594]